MDNIIRLDQKVFKNQDNFNDPKWLKACEVNNYVERNSKDFHIYKHLLNMMKPGPLNGDGFGVDFINHIIQDLRSGVIGISSIHKNMVNLVKYGFSLDDIERVVHYHNLIRKNME